MDAAKHCRTMPLRSALVAKFTVLLSILPPYLLRLCTILRAYILLPATADHTTLPPEYYFNKPGK